MSPGYEMPRFRKFLSFHPRNPALILKAACRAVGLTTEELKQLVWTTTQGELDLENPSVSAWVAACRLLHLEIDGLSCGYFPQLHLRQVGQAIYKAECQLPETERLKRVWRWYTGFQRRERKREANYYGRRLLRRIRREQLAEDVRMAMRRLRQRPSLTQVAPASQRELPRFPLPGLRVSRPDDRRGERELEQ